MRKNKILEGRRRNGIFALVLLFTTFFFSCKSTSVGNSVALLDVLDGDSSFFFYIPAQSNQKFVKMALMSFTEGLSEKDVDAIISRTDKIALASKKSDFSDFKIAAKGSYPKIAINKVFSPKNGWIKEGILLNGETLYPIYRASGPYGGRFAASFPDDFAIVGMDIESVLHNYHDLAFTTVSNDVNGKKIGSASWNQGIRDYLLSGKNGEIMFYSRDPSIVVKSLLNKNLNLGMKAIYGNITDTQNKKFSLEVIIELNDPRTMIAALSMVKLAIFPIAAKVTRQDATHIKIQDLTFEDDALFSQMKKKK